MLKKFFKHKICYSAILCVIITVPLFVYPFGKNKVTVEVFTWHILRTIHFNVYYPYGIERLAATTATIAERAYGYLADTLQHQLNEPVPIIVFPSHIDFQENNILMQIIGEGTGGFTEAFKNRVVIPFSGSYDEYQHVLVHELVHAFQFNILMHDSSGKLQSMMSMGAVPLWFTEGMSEYLSIGFDETADMTMRDFFFNDQYVSLMDFTTYRTGNLYYYYKVGQAFFYFFETVYGKGKIGEFLRDIRDMGNFEKALKVHTKKDLEAIDKEFRHFYKKRYYPLMVGRNFDEEEGERVTDHKKTRSVFNTCPAISPDGKKIAYIDNRDIYASISVITIGEKEAEAKARVLLKGNETSQFEGMHLLDNYLSWTPDGKGIVFVSQSNNRDVIFILDSRNGTIIKKIVLPFRSIKDPALSPDGNYISFIGQTNTQSDVYIYRLNDTMLQQITNDVYTERYPRLDKKNAFIYYSSNYPTNDYTGTDYAIIRHNVLTGERQVIVKAQSKNLQVDVAGDGNTIVYISNRDGIYNVYRYTIATGEEIKITTGTTGIFYPRLFPEGNAFAFVSYQNGGYDIFIKNEIKPVTETPLFNSEHIPVMLPPNYFPLSKAVWDSYETRISSDWVFVGLGGTVGYGFTGFAQMSFSDYLGDNRIIVTTDFLRDDESNNFMNYDVQYLYLRYRWDWTFGCFRQKSPYGIFTLANLNDIIHNAYWSTLSMDHYGAYVIASYPFTKFSRFSTRVSSSRYEQDYGYSDERPDVYGNLNSISVSYNYDNVLWGFLAPLRGTRGQIMLTQVFNLTGQDYSFTSIDIDLRHYFFIDKQYVIALRGVGGKIMGSEKEYFKYYIGGFNTLRGHPFVEYGGSNVFLFNAEFRFTFIESINMGWPLFLKIGNIGGVLFVDAGSAWDNSYTFFNNETDQFEDFKMDMGFGFRLTVYPIVILKLDYAWPYYYGEFGEKEILFSLGYEF